MSTVGPQVTLPLAGDYVVSYGANMTNNTAATRIYVAVKRGAAAASDNDSIIYTQANGGYDISLARSQRMNGRSAGEVLKLQYRGDGGTKVYKNRFLTVTPVRVG